MRGSWWWVSGLALIAAAAVAEIFGPDSEFAEVLFVFSVLWALGSVIRIAWWVWNWLTYRVGTRLFITYLLVGVLPVLFAITFGAVGLYILMGQYTSVRLGSELRRVRWELSHQCDTILQRAEFEGPESAEELLAELAASSHEPLHRVAWQARFGDRMVGLEGGEDLPEMAWLTENERTLTARFGDQTFGVVSAVSASGHRVTALIPLDEASARAISEAWWFDVAFLFEEGEDGFQEGTAGGTAASVTSGERGSMSINVDGRNMSTDEFWPKWAATDGSLLARPWVVWFRVVVDTVDLESGEPLEGANLLALIRTSPVNVWNDFTLSRYELGRELWGALAGLAAFFLVGYGLALAAAATVVFSIARSTSRLTQGALQVERGNLDHRVPVKRRDQLGDLARSFNLMTDSVQDMLAEVAEKERLARELELAREIQQSLLPGRQIELGPLVVRSIFQPAAEVGGDYFDVFSVKDDQLTVTIGDVAGHGLSTGLLMASLKSSVAALVHEGYSGAALIEKVNRLLLGQGRARTMVSMTVVEVDSERGRVRLANAGHPPPFLIGGGSAPRELLAGALPMGNRLCSAAETEWDFPAGSVLLLYSDGLVEAVGIDGEPFGYDRLARVLEEDPGLGGDGLISRVLDSLTEFTDNVPLADDLTLLVIEHR